MSKRIYEVQFETYVNGDGWVQNWSKRTVCVAGGAEAAIAVAKKREASTAGRLRVEQVTLIAAED